MFEVVISLVLVVLPLVLTVNYQAQFKALFLWQFIIGKPTFLSDQESSKTLASDVELIWAIIVRD